MFHSGLGAVYLRLILMGALMTIALSSASLSIGGLFGFVLGAARASTKMWARMPALAYIEVVRSIPLLIVLFLVYYGLPVVAGVDSTPFVAAVGALSIYVAAYMAEVVRAGLAAVGQGQWQACQALGFGYVKSMRLVILPQALRVIVPAAVGLFVASIKDSSLASIIGLTELTRAVLVVRQITFSNWDTLAVLTLTYFVICSVVSRAGTWIESRLAQSGRFDEARVREEVLEGSRASVTEMVERI